jgi:dATP/dGTP diphosphohydrolase
LRWEERPFYDGEYCTVFSVPGMKFNYKEIEPGLFEKNYADEADTMREFEAGRIAHAVEVRHTNEVTGGQKGMKPERFSLIPAAPMREVARVYGHGAEKYEPDNWRKGYEWTIALDALERHLNAFKGRQDIDPDSKLHHLAHAVFHCLSLMEWSVTHPELDDRA